MNPFTITNEIRDLLLGCDELTGIVGTKIFPITARMDTVGDFIVYQRDGFKEEVTKMGVARQVPLVYISAVSDDYDRSQQLATLIYNTISGEYRDPYMLIRLEDSTEDFTEGKYIQVLQFSISS